MTLSILIAVNIFKNDVLSKYTGEDATMEILLMLFASAILGFLLRHFLGYMSKKEIIIESESADSNSTAQFLTGGMNGELASLRAENDKLKRDLSACLDSYNSIKASSGKSELTKKLSAETPKVVAKPKTTAKKPATKAAPIVKSAPSPKTTAKPTVKTTAKKAISSKKDDLKMIEGVGPALEKLLNSNGITNFEQLSNATVKNLQLMLDEAGPRFRVHVPETWAEQAKLLQENKMDEFNALITKLKGGRRV